MVVENTNINRNETSVAINAFAIASTPSRLAAIMPMLIITERV
jgi:hypothetical protein